MEFSWDENKRLQNLEKHQVDFQDVVSFWDNPMIVLEDDRQHCS